MAFVLRRSFAITSALKHIPKSTSTSISTRTLHQNSHFSKTFLTPSKPATPISALAKPRNAFQKRFIQTPSVAGPNTSGLGQRLLIGGLVVGGAVVAINLVFNRETREDGGMPPFERAYLNETFAHTGLGIGIIGVAATALHRSGWSFRLMAMNPWLVIGGSLALSIGSMYGCYNTHPDK